MKLFLSILSLSVITEAAIKTWTNNTNFDNPNNWNLNRVPREADKVILKDDLAIYMPENVALREMILPLSGVLVFPNEGSFVLVELTHHGEDLVFTGGRSSYWYDPQNWNVTSPIAVNLVGDKDSLPVPHSDQVPCQHDDDIVFPIGTTFRVLFDIIPLQLRFRSITINGKMFRSEELGSFTTSEMGKLLFVKPPPMTIDDNICKNVSGCACGNDNPVIKKQICAHAVTRCPKPKCADPIFPAGHCCQICGSLLTLSYREGFIWNTIEQLFFMYIREPEFREVQGYLSKTYNDKIQMVFTDAGREKGLAANLATNIHSYLLHDINDVKMFNLISAELKTSSDWYSGDDVIPLTPQSLQASAAKTVGIIMATLIIGAILIALFMMYKKRRIPGFSFARFDSDGSRIEVELGTTPHSMLDPSSSSTSPSSPAEEEKGFDNPIYDRSMTSLENQSYIESLSEGRATKTTETRENPMFMFLDNKEEVDDLLK